MFAAASIRSLAPVLALLVLPAAARAADFCISNSGSVASVFVGRGLALPMAGKCAVWRGFCTSGCSPDNVQDGTVCTSSDGTHVSFGITTYYLAGNREFDWVRLSLPGLTGSGNVNYLLSSGTTDYSSTGAACTGGKAP